MAREESEDRSHRVRRKHLELAEQGKPAGELGWGVRNDEERELVRQAACRLLAGQGLITVVRDWNRRRVASPTDRPWGGPTLRRALLSSRMAGLREHRVDPRRPRPRTKSMAARAQVPPLIPPVADRGLASALG